ncbi:MAG: PilZ domain-containing protein [Nitrospirota bacterium]|nr:MAG: PilZ domain-containing protein [Nitrospirota bacterium]
MEGKNRRIHKRVPIAGSARILLNDGQGAFTEGLISNVSISGIGIYTDRQVDDGEDVLLELNFISSEWTMTETVIQGNVVYTKDMEFSFFTGIEFTNEIDPGSHKSLHYHIEQSLQWY